MPISIQSTILPGAGKGGDKYVLPVATKETLGGIRVGDGLDIEAGTGVLSVKEIETQLPLVSTSSTTLDIEPYKYYDITGVITSLTPTFKPAKENMTPVYFLHFVTGSSFNITLPVGMQVVQSNTTWNSMTSDIWKGNTEYEMVITNNVAKVHVINSTLILHDWFYFEDATGSDNTLSLVKSDAVSPNVTLEYSYDGTTWSIWGTTSTTPLTLTIPANSIVYLRGTNASFGNEYAYNMFSSTGNVRCGGVISSLLTRTEEPLLNLTGHDGAFYGMFREMTTLLNAPSLPATTLTYHCYYDMFYNCSSLTSAPELPATTLATGCYSHMFYGCSNLNEIHCNAVDISANNCTNKWVSNVSATGTFYRNSNNNNWITGEYGIPSGWTVVPPM